MSCVTLTFSLIMHVVWYSIVEIYCYYRTRIWRRRSITLRMGMSVISDSVDYQHQYQCWSGIESRVDRTGKQIQI